MEKNTIRQIPSKLIVNTPGCFIGKTSRQIVVRKDKKKVLEYPSLHLKDIIISGRGISMSSDVIEYCAANDIPMFFISSTGKTTAMFTQPYATGDLGLIQLQTLQNSAVSIELAKQFIYGKISNQIEVLTYLKNKNRKNAVLKRFITPMKTTLLEMKQKKMSFTQQRMFSIEARSAKSYWAGIKELFHHRFDFTRRNKQHAKDLINSMLNYGYAILQGRVRLSLMRAGLNTEISYLHTIQPGRASLVFDLMEEFRAPVIDYTVFNLLYDEPSLSLTDEGLLSNQTRSILIQSVLKRLDYLVRYCGRHISLDEVIECQANAIVQHINHQKPYQPYLESSQKRTGLFFMKKKSYLCRKH
jgi:CRISPR-associated protein Cas1